MLFLIKKAIPYTQQCSLLYHCIQIPEFFIIHSSDVHTIRLICRQIPQHAQVKVASPLTSVGKQFQQIEMPGLSQDHLSECLHSFPTVVTKIHLDELLKASKFYTRSRYWSRKCKSSGYPLNRQHFHCTVKYLLRQIYYCHIKLTSQSWSI